MTWGLARVLFAASAITAVSLNGFAATISLISGTGGAVTGVPHIYTGSRGVDLTVVSVTSVHVTAMKLDGLEIGGASSALVGARIYNSSTGVLLASADTTVTVGGSVTIPIEADFASKGVFRVMMLVSTTPPGQGYATLFDPGLPGFGGFPYTESSGQLRINGAYYWGPDTFPLATDNFVPQITLTTIPVLGTSYCYGDGSLATDCPCTPPNVVPSPSGAAGHGCANSLNLDGATLSATGSTLPDTVKFSSFVSNTYVSFGLLLKGNANAATGIAAADGIRCADGQLIRFGAHFAGTNGAPPGYWTYPNTVQTNPVSVQTAQPPGQTAFYQLFYRNTAANFCTAATTNWSNAMSFPWL